MVKINVLIISIYYIRYCYKKIEIFMVEIYTTISEKKLKLSS